MLSEVIPNEEEKNTGTLSAETLSRALGQLRETGYLIVRGICDPEHLENIRGVLDRTWEDFSRAPSWIGGGRIIGHLACKLPSTRDMVFDDVLLNPIVRHIAAGLLGATPRNLHYGGNTNLPDSVPQMFHSDVEDRTESSLVVNIPVGNVTSDNGAIELIPGTHRRQYAHDEILSLERRGDYVRAETASGDVILRYPGLLHRGTSNKSSRPRHMIGLWYAEAGSKRESETPPLILGSDCSDWAEENAAALHYTIGDPTAALAPNYFPAGFRGAMMERFYRTAPDLFRSLRALRD